MHPHSSFGIFFSNSIYVAIEILQQVMDGICNKKLDLLHKNTQDDHLLTRDLSYLFGSFPMPMILITPPFFMHTK